MTETNAAHAASPNASPSAETQPAPDPLSVSGRLTGDLFRGSLLLIALVVFTYLKVVDPGIAWNFDFIWDDDVFLYENRLIVNTVAYPGITGLLKFWFSTEPPDYFPLTSSMLWFEYRIFGNWAGGYHIVNVALHAASAVLLWRVLKQLRVPGAYVAAAVFAVHPVCVESVAWITERKNLLPMVFYLWSLHLWLRHDDGGERRLYIWSCVAFLLALLSKTSVVPLPFVLLGIAWWRRGRITKTDLVRSVPFFALSLVLGLVTVYYQSNVAIDEMVVREDSLLARLLTAAGAVWFYLGKALLPIDLSFVYPRVSLDPTQVLSWLPLAALLGVFGALLATRNAWGRAPLAALGYFVLLLAPVLGFVDIFFMRYSYVADHWQYFALPGVIALVVAIGARVVPARAATPVAAVVVLLLAATSFVRTSAYENVNALWKDTLSHNPDAWIAHSELGRVALLNGEFVTAAAHFERAVEIEPRAIEPMALLARTTHGLKDSSGVIHNPELARRYYEQALALSNNPMDRGAIEYDLGRLEEDLGRLPEALAYYEAAVASDGGIAEFYLRLANAYARRAQESEDPEVVTQLLQRSRDVYRQYLSFDETSIKAHRYLAAVLVELGEFEAAAVHYDAWMQLDPVALEPRVYLAGVYSQLGRFDAAKQQCEIVLARDPTNQDARRNLELIERALAERGE